MLPQSFCFRQDDGIGRFVTCKIKGALHEESEVIGSVLSKTLIDLLTTLGVE